MGIQNNLFAVILAGGSGTRFWPLSRKKEPKQFLKIVGEKSLFQETLGRIKSKVKSNNIFVSTNSSYARIIQKQIATFNIPESNLLLEPEGKNTAPPICWAASIINKLNSEAIMVVLPSDHLIVNKTAFSKALNQAFRLAKDDHLVTLGIVPTRPEIGYGYLRTVIIKQSGKNFLRVQQFIEKPSQQRAKKFLKTKNYLWNSGMFVWKTQVILKEFKTHLPDIHNLFDQDNRWPFVKRHWHKLPNISVDYGILEKAKDVSAVPAGKIGWSDLGSWEALTEVLRKDQKGNILNPDVISLDCHDTFVWSKKRLVATVGLNNIIIIDTPDALLVCRRDSSQRVKDIVACLKKRNPQKDSFY